MLIYKITNVINGKVYIGRTTKSEETRWKEHQCCARIGTPGYFYQALRFYGPEGFRTETLHKAGSFKELCAMETFFIVLHQSYDREIGYNITMGGEDIPSFAGRSHTELSKQKIRTALTDIPRSEEFCQKIREGQTKWWAKNPHLRKERAAIAKKRFKGIPKTAEHGRKIGLGNSRRKNPILGRKWVNNGIFSLLIKPGDIESHSADGWVMGRS
jgi:group I intron endonuclease